MESDTGGKQSLRDSVRHCVDSTISFSKMSRPELERILSDLLHGEGKNRARVEEILDELRVRSKKSVDRFSELVRAEVRREFDSFPTARREEIGEFFERLVALVGEYFGPKRARRSGPGATRPAKAAPAKKAAKKGTKAAPARKSALKTAPGKKAAAKKTAPKKAAAKRA